MAIDRKSLTAAIQHECTQIEERVPGYREALLDAVTQILLLESEHQRQRGDVVQQITEACKALGDYRSTNQS